jgi:hypothetical protein
LLPEGRADRRWPARACLLNSAHIFPRVRLLVWYLIERGFVGFLSIRLPFFLLRGPLFRLLAGLGALAASSASLGGSLGRQNGDCGQRDQEKSSCKLPLTEQYRTVAPLNSANRNPYCRKYDWRPDIQDAWVKGLVEAHRSSICSAWAVAGQGRRGISARDQHETEAFGRFALRMAPAIPVPTATADRPLTPRRHRCCRR